MSKKQKTHTKPSVETMPLEKKSSKKPMIALDQDTEKMAMVMQLVCW